MKLIIKRGLWIMAAIFARPANAQMYVGSGGVVYSKGEVVFVNQQLELTANSNFYLRNEGQLVQGTASASANKGAGTLSLYQEGRATQYTYNYWCSPVGNASSSIGNEAFGISMLGRPTNNILSIPANVNVADSDGVANPLMIANGWIFKYLQSDSPTAWIPVGNASTISAGQGFTMKGTGGTDTTIVEGNSVQNNPGAAQRYDFRGKPNDGNITVNLTASKYTLTGNPYPSALHLNAFLLDAGNTASTGTAYFWEQDMSVQSHYLAEYKGGYGTYAPVSINSAGVYVPATFNTYNSNGTLNTTGTSSGLNISRRYSPIGQGFILNGASTGTVTLKNSHRVFYKESTTSQSFFNRPESSFVATAAPDSIVETLPLIRFNISVDNQSTRQLALLFSETSTTGVDFGIDARIIPAAIWPKDVFFGINGDDYVIQGRPFDSNSQIPIHVYSADAGTFTFSVAEAIDFPLYQSVYVYDNLTDSYHDIRNANYQVQLGSGTYKDRFEIRFVNHVLSNSEQVEFSPEVVQNNQLQTLSISNNMAPDNLSVGVYDISGKSVLNDDSRHEYSYSTSAWSEGVYLVTLRSTQGKVFSKKIIVLK